MRSRNTRCKYEPPPGVSGRRFFVCGWSGGFRFGGTRRFAGGYLYLVLPVPPHFFGLAQRNGVEPQRKTLLGWSLPRKVVRPPASPTSPSAPTRPLRCPLRGLISSLAAAARGWEKVKTPQRGVFYCNIGSSPMSPTPRSDPSPGRWWWFLGFNRLFLPRKNHNGGTSRTPSPTILSRVYAV